MTAAGEIRIEPFRPIHSNATMKAGRFPIAAAAAFACAATAVSCTYAPYQAGYANAYRMPVGDSAPLDSYPEASIPPPAPAYPGVDPALVIAGVAAAGLIGYAIADQGHCHAPPPYCGPVVYGGWHGPGFCY